MNMETKTQDCLLIDVEKRNQKQKYIESQKRW